MRQKLASQTQKTSFAYGFWITSLLSGNHHSGANTPGILAINKRSIWSIPNIGIRRVKYLFNIVEHDQRAIKRGMSIPTECKEFESAQRTKLEILMHLGLILSIHWRCQKQTSTEFLATSISDNMTTKTMSSVCTFNNRTKLGITNPCLYSGRAY